MTLRITGVMIQYYKACKRELWFFANQINMNIEDENVLIGKLIHEATFLKEKKNLLIDDTISIDFKKGKENIIVFEIKKSSKLEEPAKWQLYYYLYYLKHKKGIKAEGILVYPKEKKREKLILTEEREEELKKAIKEIPEIVSSPSPLPPVRKPYCKRCSYYELCWV